MSVGDRVSVGESERGGERVSVGEREREKVSVG